LATLTAQMLVGRSHPNSGGINPTHYLFFSENDRSAWILVPENVFEWGPERSTERIVWIPTIENALEDALLMVAIYVLEDQGIRELAADRLRRLDKHAEVYEAFDRPLLEELYSRSRALEADYKIVLTLLNNSDILRQLPVLEHYKMEVEVCVATYSRQYSTWAGEWRTEGSLTYQQER
jgi:hypothetical protein